LQNDEFLGNCQIFGRAVQRWGTDGTVAREVCAWQPDLLPWTEAPALRIRPILTQRMGDQSGHEVRL